MKTNRLNTAIIAGMLLLAFTSCSKEDIPVREELRNLKNQTSEHLGGKRGKHIKDWAQKERSIESVLRKSLKKKGNGIRT